MPSFSSAAASAVASAAFAVAAVSPLPAARAWAPSTPPPPLASSRRSAYVPRSSPPPPPLFAASLDVESAASSAESNQRRLLEARLALERGVASPAAASAVADEANGVATTTDEDDGGDDVVDDLLTKIDDDEGEDVNPSRAYGFLEESDASPSTFYDLVVIGGGPAGIAGAVRAAQLGRRCLIVDRPKAGVQPSGLDLFFGAPTGLFSKALRDASKTHDAVAMRAQGLDDDVIWKQITNTVVKLASRNAAGQTRMLDRFKIGYLQGEAALLGLDDPTALEIDSEHADHDEENGDGPTRVLRISNAPIRLDGDDHPTEGRTAYVRASRVLVATGSKSMRLPGIPFDGVRVHDSETINGLSFFPKSVVIAGAGIIAIEYANIFKSLGVQDVTLLVRGDLESASAKLGMDMDCVRELTRLLVKSGVVIREGTTVDEFLDVPDEFDEPLSLKMNDGSIVETDIFLAATGRIPRGPEEGTELEKAGVSLNDRGMVELDDRARLLTKSPNVAAAGDVIGPPALASTSVEQAQRAVESLFRRPGGDPSRSVNGVDPLSFEQPISFGVWTIPEMGYYGMTKDQAEAKGHSVVEGVARFDQCLRGRVFAPDGLLKLVVDSSNGAVLGVHLIGKEAAEMVHYGMALVQSGTTVFDLLGTTFTAVTFHELFKEAALDANFKLDFGIEWQEIFAQLTEACPVVDGGRVSEDELRKRFDAIDVDGSGELDEDEIRHLFVDLGRPLSKRTIANLMRLSDTDGNGTIDWEEFSAIFRKVQC